MQTLILCAYCQHSYLDQGRLFHPLDLTGMGKALPLPWVRGIGSLTWLYPGQTIQVHSGLHWFFTHSLGTLVFLHSLKSSLALHTFLQGIQNLLLAFRSHWTSLHNSIPLQTFLSWFHLFLRRTLPGTHIRTLVITLDCVIQSHLPTSVHHQLHLQVCIIGHGRLTCSQIVRIVGILWG